MKSKALWVINGVLAVLLLGLSLIVLVRQVDGTGAVQTTQTRLLALAVLAGFAVFIITIEALVLLIIKLSSRN